MKRAPWRTIAAALTATLLIGCATSVFAPPRRPNVLLIVADDMGWSDLGALGGEIPTPNLDALAAEGVLFSNFHVAATCSPTRAMLLTGVDNHRAGIGNMGAFLTDAQRGKPGYEGHLNHRVVTLATLLRDAGYATAMAGKWHLGSEPDQRPHARGFEQSFAFLEGSGSAWSDRSAAPILGEHVGFSRNGEIVPRPQGRFSAELYVDELIGFLDATQGGEAPFFAYLAFQAVHWPHHAPDAYLEAARGAYADGWQAVRQARIEKLRELEIFAPETPASPLEPSIPAWSSLPPAQQRDEMARMEAYAAMAMAMDHEVGRLIDHLRATERYADTLILFVSDNGADPSQPERNPRARAWYEQLYPKTSPDDFGKPGSFPSTGFTWARASVTPLRQHKGQAGEGGLRVPLIAHYPKRLPSGRVTNAFGYVTDLVPTVLEATRVATAAQGGMRRTGLDLDGTSLWPLLRGRKRRPHPPDEAIGYELMGNAALFRGDLKLVQSHGEAWRLFDIVKDPGETNDLAASHVAELQEMLLQYNRYEREMGVIPVPADYDVMQMLLRTRPAPTSSR
ncbi:MAG: arylsulfatase [Deltaproteobacteria bacterium]|nr:arylsulfatase [Deltaproteobacteria bacterium]MBW2363159.1 arylsulfatase [Deltaproteobacteria bacterium]